MTGLLSIAEALRLVLAQTTPLGGEDVAVPEALGRYLLADVLSTTDLPPFDSSAMDGYAVRAADTPGVLPVRGQSAAGRPHAGSLEPGTAVVISTGAVVPAGADAVVPVERTDGSREAVRVEQVAPGENVRPRGGDARVGDTVATPGVALGPVQLGALAGAGVTTVRCGLRPRVAVLATGTELRRPGEPLATGEIYESNTAMLAAQVRAAGGIAEPRDSVADDAEATRRGLEHALEADVVLTSGGVSVGPHDLVRGLLAELGVEEVFWRVAVKPGKPIAFGVRGRTLVFGLPGNPLSSLVGFELFVRPALRALQGAADPEPSYLPGRLDAPLRRTPARDELVRARVGADGIVHPIVGQESHMIVRAAAANALALVPRGEGELAAGSSVSWLPL